VQLTGADYAAAVATADRVLAIYSEAKGGMLQSQLTIRFERAEALFALGRNDEALAEMLAIEPQYATLFPKNPLRAELVALEARALARANRAEEAEASAKIALAMDADAKSLAPDVRADLSRIAAGATSGAHVAAKAPVAHRARAGNPRS